MNIEQLRIQFPDEAACRRYFESVIWSQGRKCPHCGHARSCALNAISVPEGTYECYKCKKQFRVTTKTPLHSTKLTFWTWIQAIYYILSSSKGVSSVILGKWIGVSQPTAWRMGHAIRQIMSQPIDSSKLDGIVELDEKYFGGKPRYQPGVIHKRGRGTSKQ